MQLPSVPKKRGLISANRISSLDDLNNRDVPRIRRLDPIKKPDRLDKQYPQVTKQRQIQPISSPQNDKNAHFLPDIKQRTTSK